jgi:hypothetical protein
MCDCRLCTRARAFQAHLAHLAPAQRTFFEGIYDDLENLEMEHNHLHAVADGSWPNADEIIQRMRTERGSPAYQPVAPSA